MPSNSRKIIANVWKNARSTCMKCFHRQYQIPSTQTSEKVPNTEPLQSSSAALSASLSHDDHQIDSAFSPLDQQHEIIQHGAFHYSSGPPTPPQAEGYDDCDSPLEATEQSPIDRKKTDILLQPEQHTVEEPVNQPVFTNIRHKLKEVNRRRANVRDEKIRIEEQALVVQYKLDELNETIASLQIEFDLDLSDNQQRSSKRHTELIQAVQRASARFTTEASALDRLQKRVWNLEERLDDVETELLHLVEGDQAADGDSDSSVHSESDGGSSGLDIPHATVRVLERQSQNDVDSINELVQMPVYQESFYTGELSEQDQAEETAFQDLDSELMDLGASDSTVQSAGDQFPPIEDETSTILPEEYDLSKDNIFVRMKRRRDLASIPELWPLHKSSETTNVDHFYNPDIASFSLGHMVSYWILQYFACSWLEFSRYILFNKLEPAIDQVIVSFGHFQLSSLIYVNWFCDDNPAQPQRVLSLYPSISNYADDVPRQYHQIFVPESVDGTKDIEYIQLRESSWLHATTDFRPVSSSAQAVINERSLFQNSISSRSSKAPSQIFDQPKRMDTLDTEWADSRERILVPCNNNNSS